MVKPHHVFEDIRRRRAGSGEPDDPIRFYWVTITHEDDGGDRNRFRGLLRESAGGYPLLPAVLRVAGFEDPNAVMNDLAAVLETCRNDLQAPEVRERSVRHGFVDFVLISRREFALAATSSPLHLPDWFPVSSGQDVTARIEDLTWSAGVALSAPEAHIGEIKRLLCDLDRILLRRVREVGAGDHRLVRGILDRFQPDPAESVSLEDFLSGAQAALDNVKNPRDYRPSSRSGAVVGRLWNLTARIHPDGLGKVAGSPARALQVRAQESRRPRRVDHGGAGASDESDKRRRDTLGVRHHRNRQGRLPTGDGRRSRGRVFAVSCAVGGIAVAGAAAVVGWVCGGGGGGGVGSRVGMGRRRDGVARCAGDGRGWVAVGGGCRRHMTTCQVSLTLLSGRRADVREL